MRAAKADESNTQGAGANGGSSPYTLTFEIMRRWAGLPGATLKFKLRMYLSGELSAARETTIGLTSGERLNLMTEFRIRVLADTLIEAPEGFPDFPEKTADGKSSLLRDRAIEFFSRKDERGSYVFGLLVEDVVTEFWGKATPSPTIPASAS